MFFNRTANCNSKVDFPMPGSPPNNVNDPGTKPPPNTRFNSSSGNIIRGLDSNSISVISRGLAALVSLVADDFHLLWSVPVGTTSST